MTATDRASARVPSTPKGKRTRERILHGARKVFAKSGYVDARMVDIAAAANLSIGGLYRHFKDKEHVFTAVIAELHEALFHASGRSRHSIRAEPRAALLENNLGYLKLYHENRDVMRTFIQAATVEPRFRKLWWRMRKRHVDRFVSAMIGNYGIKQVSGVDLSILSQALACMVEQSAFVWFAHESESSRHVSVIDAANAVTEVWCAAVFGGLRAHPLWNDGHVALPMQASKGSGREQPRSEMSGGRS